MLLFESNLVITLLNNNGYAIEKIIHGPDRAYNNIQMWRYDNNFQYFGNGLKQNQEQTVTDKVASREEFESIMPQVLKENNKIHFVEVIMPAMDAPKSLIVIIEGTKEYKRHSELNS